jgi:hypothetical protein
VGTSVISGRLFRVVVVTASLGVAAALLAAATTTRADDPKREASQRNLVSNGSFEQSLTGWSGLNARLLPIKGGAAGRAAARVTAVSAGRDFSIYSVRHLPAVAGAEYTASGWVRSQSTLPVCLRLREWSDRDVVNSDERCVRPHDEWVKFPTLRLAVTAPARELDVYAYRLTAERGSRFDVDGLTLLATRATRRPAASGGATLIAAGDIARCGADDDSATARLLDELRGTIATLGDNAYESGTSQEFARCYATTWGRHKSRTRPSPGNHDYHTRDAAGYFDYFGAAAGTRGKGYYSYSVGRWHVISLNSNCGAIGGCHRGSPQERWLRADLRASRARCTLAYWHHARFSSGEHGSDSKTQGLWEALHAARADVILVGHDHNYERFAPMRPNGALDRRRGIRQFVVGTGGARLRPIEERARHSEVRNSNTHGVLVLKLRPSSYSWRFVPVAGKSFTDSGTGACH